MRLALVALNPTVGDVDRNAESIRAAVAEAGSAGADLVVFPELAITAYPPRDLFLQHGFAERCREVVLSLARDLPPGLTAVVGTPWRPPLGRDGEAEPDAFDARAPLTNSLMVLRHEGPVARHDKRLLPDYDVFDEPRYFRAGSRAVVVEVAGVRTGLAVCEDFWKGDDARNHDRYRGMADPIEELKAANAELVVLSSASPFIEGKSAMQSRILAETAGRTGLAIAAVNMAGANDDLIFDGHAAVYVPPAGGRGGAGRVVAVSPPFGAGTLHAELPAEVSRWVDLPALDDPWLKADPERLLFDALVTGVRDYARKTGMLTATLGVSGGIDSALVATLAAAAIGGGEVLGVTLPSRYSSDHSLADADELGRRLGMPVVSYPIEAAHDVFERTLRETFDGLGLSNEPGVTEENVQSRIRGLAMMALSNKSGRLLLTTGNKSEHAVGYATLYGDQNGGLAPIADVLKTDCYRLARYINDRHAELGFARPPIPENTIAKPPSAELRPGQTDQDTLPPYEELDSVIALYVDEARSVGEIVAETGFAETMVREIVRKIDLAEYKRFQLCVALKMRPRAFGPGRRWPIVAKPGR